VDTGSREENASKQQSGAQVLIPSEPIMLWCLRRLRWIETARLAAWPETRGEDLLSA
jgi:hypothetical protein